MKAKPMLKAELLKLCHDYKIELQRTQNQVALTEKANASLKREVAEISQIRDVAAKVCDDQAREIKGLRAQRLVALVGWATGVVALTGIAVFRVLS